MTNSDHAINGFLKAAADYGMTEADARTLLKEAGPGMLQSIRQAISGFTRPMTRYGINKQRLNQLEGNIAQGHTDMAALRAAQSKLQTPQAPVANTHETAMGHAINDALNTRRAENTAHMSKLYGNHEQDMQAKLLSMLKGQAGLQDKLDVGKRNMMLTGAGGLGLGGFAYGMSGSGKSQNE